MAKLDEKVLAKINTKHNAEARNMPIFANATFTIKVPTTEEEAVNFTKDQGTWDGIQTEEGMLLSTTALTRKGNGLELEGNDTNARLVSLCSLAKEIAGVNVINIQVTKIEQRKSVDPETGALQMRNYYFFKLI